MIDSDRIGTYAQKLQHSQVFRNLLLANIATGLSQQRLSDLFASDPTDLDVLDFDPDLEGIGVAEQRILTQLEHLIQALLKLDAFWEEAAIWILTRLDLWEKDQQAPDPTFLAAWLDGRAIAPESSTFGWVDARLMSACALQVTQNLLIHLDIKHNNIDYLHHIVHSKELFEDLSILFKNQTIQNVNDYPIITGAQALINHQWKGNDHPYWRRLIGDDFIEHQIIRQNPETQRIELVPGKAAWEIIQQFGPEAAYIFLIFSSYATDAENPWEGHIQLKGTDLINLYGWDKRTDITLGKKLKRIGRLIELVCSLSVSIRNIDVRKKRYKIATSPMWLLEELEYSGKLALTVTEDQLESTSYEAEEPDELTIRIRPGRWTEKFLNESGQQEKDALRQYGYLAKSTLQINPYRKRMAAKLAIFLTVMSRIRPDGRYTIADILSQVETADILSEIHRNKEKRSKLIKQWDVALLTLQQLGWKIIFDPHTYPDWIRPAWSLTEGRPSRTQNRPKHWLETWLQARLVIQPTTLIQHRLEASKLLVNPRDEKSRLIEYAY